MLSEPIEAYHRGVECVQAVICDVAEVVDNGKLNIMGVFTDVYPEGLPAAISQAYVVATFSGSPAEVGRQRALRLDVRDADGNEIGFSDDSLTLPPAPRPGARAQVNVLMRMAPLILPSAGDFSFHILIDGDEKRTLSLHVNPPPGS